ncbi:MAG: endonuclease [Gemmatimonadetes bacterium]|nr:endonuclease [Gemmatimonadota bacterium]
MRRSERVRELREEVEHRIRTGTCVYCRAPAAPDRPLTREHVIPRARGGGRKDARIIVPACARCNHLRGCQEIVLFLIARPHRIAAFLEYLATLPPETVRQIDLRVFAELYAAVWLLGDSASGGDAWRARLRRLCEGRRLHRRRHAARRIVSAVSERLDRARDRGAEADGPSCVLPHALDLGLAAAAHGGLGRTVAAFVGTLSVAWGVPAERVMEELARERARVAVQSAVRRGAFPPACASGAAPDFEPADEEDGVVPLDGWRQRRAGRRRTRVDARRGRGSGYGRGGYRRGRAA